MKTLITVILVLTAIALVAHADDLDSNLNTLGGTPSITRRAKRLQPQNKVAVVQNRTVDRNMRFELGINYGMVSGGDSYIQTQSLGASADFHINPNWSVGARYYDFSNTLTSAGQQAYEQATYNATVGGVGTAPAVDMPLYSTIGVVSFYPLYGKLNMFDMGVAQFDLYVLGGGGQMMLQSGPTATWTAGGGIGIWVTNHVTTRVEVRYQGYTDQSFDTPRQEGTVVSTFSIGFLI
jgi:outer membrane beta-barrel protein